MFIKLVFALLSIFPAQGAQAAVPELVFYDSIEINSDGESVLQGGVYKDDRPGTMDRQFQKGTDMAPVDGYYHIRFVVDAKSSKRARDFSDLLLNHEAFAAVRDRFRIEYVEGDADQMKCGNNVPESPRIIRCEMPYILSLGTTPAHMTAVFTSRGSGGSGGTNPIISIDYPLPGMLHEMLHAWTLQDEYIYSQSEADFYCHYAKILKSPNTTTFATLESYTSDADARNRHWDDIPWIDGIRAPITSSVASSTTINASGLALGTPMTGGGLEPGLYPGSNCSRKLPSFRPYGVATIMKTLSTTLLPPIHKKAVLAAIAKAAGW